MGRTAFALLYTKADDTEPTKRFVIRGYSPTNFFIHKLKFRAEGHFDLYATLSRSELLALLREHAARYENSEHETFAPIIKHNKETIFQIESDTTEYELYKIHLAEW